MDEDSTLNELRGRIGQLKEQRGELMNDLIAERKEVELMQAEMMKMKKEKAYLDNLIKEKSVAAKEYDRIIAESERTLSKVPPSLSSSATILKNSCSVSTTSTASTCTNDSTAISPTIFPPTAVPPYSFLSFVKLMNRTQTTPGCS
jgi:hypothetical protein